MTMKATWMMTMEEMAKEHSDAEASCSNCYDHDKGTHEPCPRHLRVIASQEQRELVCPNKGPT